MLWSHRYNKCWVDRWMKGRTHCMIYFFDMFIVYYMSPSLKWKLCGAVIFVLFTLYPKVLESDTDWYQ